MTKIWPSDVVQDDALAFFRLRIAFGVLGVLLPLLLALAGLVADGQVQPTISDIFHTTQRDFLVGGLVAIGVFLMVHRGWRRYPGRWVSPDLIAFVAGLAAVGVALFPNESDTVSTFTQRTLGLGVSPVFHYASACLLYLMMSLTCFLAYAPDAEGWERKFYIGAGAIVWTTGWNVMILSGIKNSGNGWLADFIQTQNIVYWDESLGVWAFSVSWLLKAVMEKRRHGRKLAQARAARLHGPDARPLPEPPAPAPDHGRTRSWLARVARKLRQLSAPSGPAPQTAQGSPLPMPHQITLHRHRRVEGRALPAAYRGRGPAHRRTG